jgi:hypothetical protein
MRRKDAVLRRAGAGMRRKGAVIRRAGAGMRRKGAVIRRADAGMRRKDAGIGRAGAGTRRKDAGMRRAGASMPRKDAGMRRTTGAVSRLTVLPFGACERGSSTRFFWSSRRVATQTATLDRRSLRARRSARCRRPDVPLKGLRAEITETHPTDRAAASRVDGSAGSTREDRATGDYHRPHGRRPFDRRRAPGHRTPHGRPARFVEAVEVDERFNGEAIWRGAVEVPSLEVTGRSTEALYAPCGPTSAQPSRRFARRVCKQYPSLRASLQSPACPALRG